MLKKTALLFLLLTLLSLMPVGSVLAKEPESETIDFDDYMLDLGDVRESARVKINGTEVAKIVALPMRSKVGRYLKKGANTIEIEVTNLSANRIRDLDRRKVKWKIMGNANIRGLQAGGWPLQPSGLLGSVTLSPLSRTRP